MSSCESVGFHKFCRKYLPFLLIKCKGCNLHFFWRNKCVCCVGENSQGEYKFNYLKWKWESQKENK